MPPLSPGLVSPIIIIAFDWRRRDLIIRAILGMARFCGKNMPTGGMNATAT